MKFLKTFFFSFLLVFFANYMLPGIEVIDTTKLPHIGGDLLFSLSLGLLNTAIYPVFKYLVKPPSVSRIAITAFALNFAVYGVVKFLPLGISITAVEGYLLAAVLVSSGSFFLNYKEMKEGHNTAPKHQEPHHPKHHEPSDTAHEA